MEIGIINIKKDYLSRSEGTHLHDKFRSDRTSRSCNKNYFPPQKVADNTIINCHSLTTDKIFNADILKRFQIEIGFIKIIYTRYNLDCRYSSLNGHFVNIFQFLMV